MAKRSDSTLSDSATNSVMDEVKEPSLWTSVLLTQSTSQSSIPSNKDFSTQETTDVDNTNDSAASDPALPPFRPGLRFHLAWASLCIVTLMAALDATSLSVALSQIARSLAGSTIEAFWAGTSFLLTSTVFQPVIGSLSSIFGRKALLMVSLVFFGAGAIIAALARRSDGMAVLLVGRSVQGVGGGGVIVLAEILGTDMVPLRQRGLYMAMINAMWAFGSVGGPLIGGAFTQHNEWRWIFWINLPFIIVGGCMIFAFLHLQNISPSIAQSLCRIDIIGMILFIGSITGVLIPLTWGGVQYGWSSWHTLVPLILSALGFCLFLFWEAYMATDPLIPLRILKSPTAAATYACTFFHGLVLWCMLYYLPLYFEAVRSQSPIITGICVFPDTFSIAPAAIAVGIIVTLTGSYRWSIWAGWVLTVIGCGLMTLLTPTIPTYGWVLINLVSGVGCGMLFPGLAFAIQAESTDADAAAAVSLFTFSRSFGQAIGVALGGVIFQNQMLKNALSSPLTAARAGALSADASAMAEILKTIPRGPLREQIVLSYCDALRAVWAACAGFAFAGLVASVFIRHYSLDRALGSSQKFQEGEKRNEDETIGMVER